MKVIVLSSDLDTVLFLQLQFGRDGFIGRKDAEQVS